MLADFATEAVGKFAYTPFYVRKRSMRPSASRMAVAIGIVELAASSDIGRAVDRFDARRVSTPARWRWGRHFGHPAVT